MVVATIFESEVPLSATAVSSMAHSEVRCDWAGRRLSGALRWSLARDRERLWVSIELPAAPPTVAKHKLGEFIEGLAESDVVELFLMGPSGCYQEWHASPDGAWWAMSFVGYRERNVQLPRPEGVAVEVFRSPESWRAVLSIPLSCLTIKLTQETRLHVSGIAYPPEGTPTYLSSAGSPQFEPDFHDARCFERVCFSQP